MDERATYPCLCDGAGHVQSEESDLAHEFTRNGLCLPQGRMRSLLGLLTQ
jgi:hypothetical protein